MNTKTKIINIFGGPGVGKSTIATGIFSKLKQNSISCELVSEYAKEITWEETQVLLQNQIHLFAEQFRRQYRLLDKVDFVICDSPLLLNSIYFKHFLEKSQKKYFTDDYISLASSFFDETFDEFNNINFFVHRNDKYHTLNGRVHSIEESKKIDSSILDSLSIYDPGHYVCKGETNEIIDKITEIIINV